MTSKKDNLVILGIETSCDDTSVSILINGKIASLCSESSLAKHKTTGGIVPEVAARGHENSITRVYEKALKNAGIAQEAITHIAYTDHPGLPGSLHIGKIFAKSLAYLLNIPALPIDHMMGHAFSYAINKEGVVKFPLLSFVVSGGNTILYYFSNLAEYKIVNETQDDPVGECLDKIGRTLGLSYPGGVSIDKNYNEKYANIKMIDHQSPQTNFSFSGIKSHILNLVNQSKMKKTSVSKIALGSSALK
jgi:N6-L-threonylcarbamoyladenine synthase